MPRWSPEAFQSLPVYRRTRSPRAGESWIGYCEADEVDEFRPLSGGSGDFAVVRDTAGPLYVPEHELLKNEDRVIVLGRELRRKALRLHQLGLTRFDLMPGPLGGEWLLDPDFVARHDREWDWLYDRLEDEESRRTLLSVLRARQARDPGYLHIAKWREYEHPRVRPESGDFVIEGGVGDGVTTARIARLVAPHGRVLGFEPDPANRRIAWDHLTRRGIEISDPLVEIRSEALWEACGEVRFAGGEGGRSHVIHDGDEEFPPLSAPALVPTVSLDSLFTRGAIPVCNLLKLDIEGAERECLLGAASLLKELRPKLQISLYHHPEDLFRLPRLIDELCPGRTFYLAHHSPSPLETNLYVE